MFPPKLLDIFSPEEGGCSEGLNAFRFFLNSSFRCPTRFFFSFVCFCFCFSSKEMQVMISLPKAKGNKDFDGIREEDE